MIPNKRVYKKNHRAIFLYPPTIWKKNLFQTHCGKILVFWETENQVEFLGKKLMFCLSVFKSLEQYLFSNQLKRQLF